MPISSELQNRVIYGIIAAIISLLAIWQGGYIFFAYVLLLSFLMSLEFDKLRGDGKIVFLFCVVPILLSYHPQVSLLLVMTSVMVIMIGQYSSKRYYPWLIIGTAYISIPAVALIWLRAQPHGFEAVFWLIIVVIATDTGAYFAGRRYGKNLLAPSISPKKTWEGLAGGLAAAAVVSFLYRQQFTLALAAIAFAVIAQVSDLMESAIKRSFNVKDTGNILPGHGGVMDRLDSLVLTAPLLAFATYEGMVTW